MPAGARRCAGAGVAHPLGMRRLLLCALLIATACPAAAAPLTDHPRLWVRGSDLPALRAWATPANPVFEQGLKALATDFKARMRPSSTTAA